jgi:hypothetical protein
MSGKVKVVVQQDEDNPVEVPILAQSIVDISRAFKALQKSGLNRKAIVVLVAHASGEYHSTTNKILDALEQLEASYTVPKTKR